MPWNWQHPEWPQLRYDAARIARHEASFLKQGGVLLGLVKHLVASEREAVTVELFVDEGVTSSAIEGEALERLSVRSSLQRALGMAADTSRVRPAEAGMAALMAELYRDPAPPFSAALLHRWHALLMQGRHDLRVVGGYRMHTDAMQIVSGRLDRPTVHFEAPPASAVPVEMERFLEWLNASADTVPAIARAGLAHVHFESIHPYEDGNGRLGRALSEKVLAQALGQASVTLLSQELEARRSEYYAALHRASTGVELTDWLEFFAEIVLAAQRRAHARIDFVLAKTRLFERLRGRLNARQEKALARVLAEGPSGFVGGLSSAKYQAITRASPATAGRDLAELVALGALRKTGTGKGTRYWVVLD